MVKTNSSINSFFVFFEADTCLFIQGHFLGIHITEN